MISYSQSASTVSVRTMSKIFYLHNNAAFLNCGEVSELRALQENLSHLIHNCFKTSLVKSFLITNCRNCSNNFAAVCMVPLLNRKWSFTWALSVLGKTCEGLEVWWLAIIVNLCFFQVFDFVNRSSSSQTGTAIQSLKDQNYNDAAPADLYRGLTGRGQ